MSTADCQARYRAKRRAAGNPVKSGGRQKADYFDRFFVAIDSEGQNYEYDYGPSLAEYERVALEDYRDNTEPLPDNPSDKDCERWCLGGWRATRAAGPGPKTTIQRHRTFLWGAAASAPHPDQSASWLTSPLRKGLTSVKILDWLMSLRECYGPRAIFVMFALSYDVTQALADLPLHKMKAVQSQKGTSYVIWNGFCIRYLKGKYISIGRMLPGGLYRESKPNPCTKCTPDAPCEYHKGKPPKERNIINCGPCMTIYDVWGFFQCSFLKLIESTPGCASKADKELIEKGKTDRLDFSSTSTNEIQAYTGAELRVLNSIMLQLRCSLEKIGLRLVRWNGAGSIASAAMKKHNVKVHYPHVEAREELLLPEQVAAQHAYFGGRIELLQYGTHKGDIYSYDIASAYPYAQLTLPSMAFGTWEEVAGPKILDVERWSPLSMVEVKWELTGPFPLGPFPYRTPQGAVYYPPKGWGIYCVEELCAVLRASEGRMPVSLELLRAWRYFPRAVCPDPFNYFLPYYKQRQDLVAAHKAGGVYDMREKVLKLALNASYGKTAQKVGGHNSRDGKPRPPPTANPWYAAVITARIRARLLDAAMLDPYAIIMMATDGIYSTRPLPLPISEEKELGAWEAGRPMNGGQFVQSGVYFLEGARSCRTRGIRLDGAEGLSLSETVGRAWQKGKKQIDYTYRKYVTLGAASCSEGWRSVVGCWLTGERSLKITGGGAKRECFLGGSPHLALIPTRPCDIDSLERLSHPHIPEWVSADQGIECETEEESATVLQSKYGE